MRVRAFKFRIKTGFAIKADKLLFSLKQKAYYSVWIKTIDTRLQQLGFKIKEIFQLGNTETLNTVKCCLTKLNYEYGNSRLQSLFNSILNSVVFYQLHLCCPTRYLMGVNYVMASALA